MIDTLVENLVRLNKILGQEIFDVKIPIAYAQLKQNCLIKDFHRLFNFKSVENKNAHIQQMTKVIIKITPFSMEQILKSLSSSKNTDITKFLTQILITDLNKRDNLEKIRKHLVIDIRKNKVLNFEVISAFQLLYSKIYAVSQVQKQITNHDIYSDLNYLKKMLTSLKKLMGQSKHQANILKKKKDHYSIHLDMKQLIYEISVKLSGTKQGSIIKVLFEKSQSNKWLGPRLYKLIEQQKWSQQSTMIFMNQLRSIKLQKKDIRTSPETIKVVIKQIMNKLRIYRKNCKKNNKQKPKTGKQEEEKMQEALIVQNKIFKEEEVPDSQSEGKLLLKTNNQCMEDEMNYNMFKQFQWQDNSFLKIDQNYSQQLFSLNYDDSNQISKIQ